MEWICCIITHFIMYLLLVEPVRHHYNQAAHQPLLILRQSTFQLYFSSSFHTQPFESDDLLPQHLYASDVFCNESTDPNSLPLVFSSVILLSPFLLYLFYSCTVHLQKIIFQLGLNVDKLTTLVALKLSPSWWSDPHLISAQGPSSDLKYEISNGPRNVSINVPFYFAIWSK